MKYYTIKEIAEKVRVKESTVERWISARGLKSYGKKPIVSEDDLNDFLLEHPKYHFYAFLPWHLNNGDFVQLRASVDENKRGLIGVIAANNIVLRNGSCIDILKDYDLSLRFKNDNRCDVVRVYRPKHNDATSFDAAEATFSAGHNCCLGEIIFDRIPDKATEKPIVNSSFITLSTYYNVKDTAELLKVNPETVRRWIRKGTLNCIKTSRKEGFIISGISLNEFLIKHPKYKSCL